MDYYSVPLFHMDLHFSDQAPSSFLDFLTVFSDLLNYLKLWFPFGGNSDPQGTFGNIWSYFWLSQLGRKKWVASIWWVEGGNIPMLLNILHGTGRSPKERVNPKGQ